MNIPTMREARRAERAEKRLGCQVKCGSWARLQPDSSFALCLCVSVVRIQVPKNADEMSLKDREHAGAVRTMYEGRNCARQGCDGQKPTGHAAATPPSTGLCLESRRQQIECSAIFGGPKTRKTGMVAQEPFLQKFSQFPPASLALAESARV
jgi:hypothetical protein